MPKRESPAEGFEVELPSDGQQPDDVRDFIVEHCWGDVGPIRVIANDCPVQARRSQPTPTESWDSAKDSKGKTPAVMAAPAPMMLAMVFTKCRREIAWSITDLLQWFGKKSVTGCDVFFSGARCDVSQCSTLRRDLSCDDMIRLTE